MIDLPPPPTETGKLMYPDDPAGYYTANGDMVLCTCKPTDFGND